MKGIYKTKEGSKVEVLNFDEANKIVMIKVDELRNKWVDEAEYKEWEPVDQEQPQEPINQEESKVEIPYEEPLIEQSNEEEPETPKKKRTYKKKEK